MKADYIEIAEKKYRVESNWNSFEKFCSMTGRTNLSSLDDMKEIKLNEAPILLWSCMEEGEELDGRKLDLTIKELKRKITPAIMGQFFKIYTKQTYAQLPKEYQTKKK